MLGIILIVFLNYIYLRLQCKKLYLRTPPTRPRTPTAAAPADRPRCPPSSPGPRTLPPQLVTAPCTAYRRTSLYNIFPLPVVRITLLFFCYLLGLADSPLSENLDRIYTFMKITTVLICTCLTHGLSPKQLAFQVAHELQYSSKLLFSLRNVQCVTRGILSRTSRTLNIQIQTVYQYVLRWYVLKFGLL